MTRSVWKGPFVDGYLLKKADAARNSGITAINLFRFWLLRIWSAISLANLLRPVLSSVMAAIRKPREVNYEQK